MPQHPTVNAPLEQHTPLGASPSSTSTLQSTVFIELDSDGEIMPSQSSNQLVIEISSDEQSSDEQSSDEQSSNEQSFVDSGLSKRPTVHQRSLHSVAISSSRCFESDIQRALNNALNENRDLKESLDKIMSQSISLVCQILAMALHIFLTRYHYSRKVSAFICRAIYAVRS